MKGYVPKGYVTKLKLQYRSKNCEFCDCFKTAMAGRNFCFCLHWMNDFAAKATTDTMKQFRSKHLMAALTDRLSKPRHKVIRICLILYQSGHSILVSIELKVEVSKVTVMNAFKEMMEEQIRQPVSKHKIKELKCGKQYSATTS